MFTIIRNRLLLVLVTLSVLPLYGCPQQTLLPVLTVSPVALSFGNFSTERSFTIRNSGGGALTWTAAETESWLELDVTNGTTTTETDRVTLTADRTGLQPGVYNTTVEVTSNAGNFTVLIALSVPGTPTIQVNPESLSFFGTTEEQSFTLTNLGDGSLSWSLHLESPDEPGTEIDIPAFMTISPLAGLTPATESAEIDVTIDRSQIPDGTLSFVLVIDSNAGTQFVSINIGQGVGPKIAVEPPVLDFGTQLNTLTFDVYNPGDLGSILDFTVTTDRSDLIFVDPTTGQSTGTTADTAQFTPDFQTITVSIDRGAMTGATDGGTVFVSAPGLDPVEVLVSIEASPLTFEGATNRSRPPFLQRFVFIMRDSQGNAIDTTDPAIFAELQNAFSVEEDGNILDPDETNVFITGPDNLKTNVVVLLDFTASMFNAAPGNGAAITQMVSSAGDFVADLPDSYRIALMEYHERQQANRLIQGFTTSKATLDTALTTFSLPANENGASEIYDALFDAITRLGNEDLNAVPFDDADVRAVVFISDGRDTSSINTLEETLEHATENRVRLYPIGFGQNVNAAPLVRMATESGGHYYPAPTVNDLVNLLENELDFGVTSPGLVTKDLSRQIVLTYLSLFQEGQHTYVINAEYDGVEGFFEKDAVIVYGGDVRGGQLALRTSGIEDDGSVEVFVRAEYIPRNISQFRLRFITGAPFTLDIPQGSLLEGWTILNEGGGIFTVLTTEDNPLPYGTFGNLLRLRFTGVVAPFTLGFRSDNSIYVNPPLTKFFQYPDAIDIIDTSSSEGVIPVLLGDGFNPDSAIALDRDEDGVSDFADNFPDNENAS